MIIIFALLQIAYSLYYLEVIDNNLLIEIDKSHKAILIFQGYVSQIKDENNYLDCPFQTQGCVVQVVDDTNKSLKKYQLQISEFHIYDQEKHTYNTEIFSFFHQFMEYSANEDIQNFLSLSPLASVYNSFVYFGYTLCISQDDGYLKTNQNEAILKNQNKMTGIRSKVQENQRISNIFSIRIEYLEVQQQIFDISNYSIILNYDIENCIIPIELMMRIFNQALQYEFISASFNSEFQFYLRETNQQRIENLGLIKFYNFKTQPLLILPEDYLSYNYENAGIDILKFVGDTINSQIVLGQNFLKNKIIHYYSEDNEIFIEQLQEERCNHKQIQKETIFDFLIFKIIFVIIILIILYGIFRKIRAQYLWKKNKKIEQQQLILNNEAKGLK